MSLVAYATPKAELSVPPPRIAVRRVHRAVQVEDQADRRDVLLAGLGNEEKMPVVQVAFDPLLDPVQREKDLLSGLLGGSCTGAQVSTSG